MNEQDSTARTHTFRRLGTSPDGDAPANENMTPENVFNTINTAFLNPAAAAEKAASEKTNSQEPADPEDDNSELASRLEQQIAAGNVSIPATYPEPGEEKPDPTAEGDSQPEQEGSSDLPEDDETGKMALDAYKNASHTEGDDSSEPQDTPEDESPKEDPREEKEDPLNGMPLPVPSTLPSPGEPILPENQSISLTVLFTQLQQQQLQIQRLQSELAERNNSVPASLVNDLQLACDDIRDKAVSELFKSITTLDVETTNCRKIVGLLEKAVKDANQQFANYSRAVHEMEKLDKRSTNLQKTALTDMENAYRSIAENHKKQMTALGTEVTQKYKALINQSPWRADNSSLWLSMAVVFLILLDFARWVTQ